MFGKVAGATTPIPNALPSAEKMRRQEALQQRVFDLECDEEHLIDHAHAQGVDLDRRESNLNPFAILGVKMPAAFARARRAA